MKKLISDGGLEVGRGGSFALCSFHFNDILSTYVFSMEHGLITSNQVSTS